MNQEKRVLEYMEEFGSITALEALRDLGIMRLASRICDLKKRPDFKARGYTIVMEYERGVNRYGEKTKYARYRLGGKE